MTIEPTVEIVVCKATKGSNNPFYINIVCEKSGEKTESYVECSSREEALIIFKGLTILLNAIGIKYKTKE